MTFPTKEWKNQPTETTPISAAALVDLEKRVTAPHDNLALANVKDYGASGNGVADDTSAIQTAINTLPAEGGVVFFPRGTYNFSAIDLKSQRSIVLRGLGGLSAGATQATVLNCVAEGTGRGIDARESLGLVFEDMSIQSNLEAFTGTLLDIGEAESETAYFHVNRCYLGSNKKVATLVNVNGVQLSGFAQCIFAGGKTAVSGVATAEDYSNAITFDGCTFKDQGTIAVKNPGEAWTFKGCGFEPLSSGAEGGILCELKAEGVAILGCWFGDSNDSGTWVKFHGYGLVMSGNEIGNGLVGVEVSAESVGISICGNKFESCTTGIKLASGATQVHVLGNYYVTTTTPVTLSGGTPSGLVQVIDSELNAVTVGTSLTFGGDNTTRIYRRAAGTVNCVGTLEALGSLKANQGGQRALTLAEEFLFAAGTNTNQNLYIDAKGAGRIELNTQKGATLGTIIEAAAGKVGFYGTTPIVKPAALTAANNETVDNTYGEPEAKTITNLRTRLNEVETKLKALGLLA